MEAWQLIVVRLEKELCRNLRRFPELQPLCSAFANFNRKYRVPKAPVKLSDAAAALSFIELESEGLAFVSKKKLDQLTETINRQIAEIEALEFRIKTLLEH
ncbi:MAG TPA: hypothetical protein VI298_09335 [Geobacteraceae bacterium]